MYAPNTPHPKGHNPKQYKKRELALQKTQLAIDKVAQKVFTLKKLNENNDMVAPSEEEIHSGAALAKALKAEAVTAFLIFEYSESMARAIEDHDRYSRFPLNFFYPEVSFIAYIFSTLL